MTDLFIYLWEIIFRAESISQSTENKSVDSFILFWAQKTNIMTLQLFCVLCYCKLIILRFWDCWTEQDITCLLSCSRYYITEIILTHESYKPKLDILCFGTDMVDYFRWDIIFTLVFTGFFKYIYIYFLVGIKTPSYDVHYPPLQGSPQPRAETVCQRYREIDIRELGWIPPRWFLWWWGWPCVKVNVKGLFVPAQQPGMREREREREDWRQTWIQPCDWARSREQHSPTALQILIGTRDSAQAPQV